MRFVLLLVSFFYHQTAKGSNIRLKIFSGFEIFQVYKQLVEKTKTTPGAIVENNKFCVSVHYRCVEEKV